MFYTPILSKSNECNSSKYEKASQKFLANNINRSKQASRTNFCQQKYIQAQGKHGMFLMRMEKSNHWSLI